MNSQHTTQLVDHPSGPPPGKLGTVSATDDGRYALCFERHLAHPPAKVWRALTDPAHLNAWFPAIVNFDLTPGARIRFDVTDEQKARYKAEDLPADTTNGQMLRVDRPHLLEYKWDEEILRWELADDGAGGCHLVFTHILDDRDLIVPVSAGWHAGLEVFEAQLDSQPITWSMWDRSVALNEDYAPTIS